MEPVYTPVIGLARVLFAAQGLRFTLTGLEHVPRTGGAVMAVNHTIRRRSSSTISRSGPTRGAGPS